MRHQHGDHVRHTPGGVLVCAGCGHPVNHIGGPCAAPVRPFEGLLDRVWMEHLRGRR